MSRSEEHWLENYNSFKDYVTENIKMPSVGDFSPTGVDLCGWFRNQRNSYRNGKLSQDKVSMLNDIVKGILEKPVRDVNIDLYLKYRVVSGDKYNPDVVYLYKKGAIGSKTLSYCIGKGIHFLKELLLSVGSGAKSEKLLYMIMQTLYELPEYCYCSLYCDIIDVKGLSFLYLEDSKKFIDHYINGMKNFKMNYKCVVSSVRISERRRELLEAYYGLDTDKGRSLKDVATIFDISVATVKRSIDSVISTIRNFMKCGSYDDSFENFVLDNPYEADFSSFTSISKRTFNCLKRSGINSFKDLHDYLVSVFNRDNSAYSGGLSTIRNMGVVSAKEICEIARKYGVYDKVFVIKG